MAPPGRLRLTVLERYQSHARMKSLAGLLSVEGSCGLALPSVSLSAPPRPRPPLPAGLWLPEATVGHCRLSIPSTSRTTAQLRSAPPVAPARPVSFLAGLSAAPSERRLPSPRTALPRARLLLRGSRAVLATAERLRLTTALEARRCSCTTPRATIRLSVM